MRKARLEYGITQTEDDKDDKEGLLRKGSELSDVEIEGFVGNKDSFEIHGGKHNTTPKEQFGTLAFIIVVIVACVLIVLNSRGEL